MEIEKIDLDKISKSITLGRWLLALGLVFFFMQNQYFGWHMQAESDLEKWADWFNKMLLLAGVALQHFAVTDYVQQGIKLIKHQQKLKGND